MRLKKNSFFLLLFIYLFTLFQNWLAFSYLDEPPFSEHNSIYFSNDKPPAQSHYNAFCKVSIPVLSLVFWVSIPFTVQFILLNKFTIREQKQTVPLSCLWRWKLHLTSLAGCLSYSSNNNFIDFIFDVKISGPKQ